MKSKLFLFLAGAIFLLYGKAFAQGGWVFYENSVLMDLNRAKEVAALENTPESVVTFFYASKIRGDGEWEKVVLPEAARSRRFQKNLHIYDTWKFNAFRLISKNEYEKNKCWVKVYLQIEFEGMVEDGEDEVTLEKINGKWLIVSVPT